MNDLNPRGFPTPPFDTPQQKPPGLSSKMKPQPDYGEGSYVGSGRLKGKKTLITGADSGIGRAAVQMPRVLRKAPQQTLPRANAVWLPQHERFPRDRR
jgi:hypothetical protein